MYRTKWSLTGRLICSLSENKKLNTETSEIGHTSVSRENDSALEALEPELQDTDMSVTPNEIRNAEFATTMRGFNRDQVDEFLQKTASTLEDALAEIIELREQQKLLQTKYDKLAAMEDSLKSTLLEAQKTADAIRANAEHDVQLALERAKGKQSLIEKQAQSQIDLLQDKVRELDTIRLDYQRKIRETIESHLKVVDEISFSAELPELSIDDVLADTEPAEIEEVTLFETAAVEIAVDDATVGEDATSDVTGPAAETKEATEGKVKSEDSLHSDITHLTDSDTHDKQAQEEREAPVQSDATPDTTPGASSSETIAQAVEQVERQEPVADATDDTLYKKLASDNRESHEASQDTSEEVTQSEAAIEANTEASAPSKESDKSSPKKQQSRPPLDTGPDGIIVFGRKEDREKAVEENARILSELDSVVDKFAEELCELDGK